MCCTAERNLTTSFTRAFSCVIPVEISFSTTESSACHQNVEEKTTSGPYLFLNAGKLSWSVVNEYHDA